MVMVFFSSKISIVSLVLIGYEFVLPCVHFVYLVLLDHSTSDCVSRVLMIETVVMLICKNHALLLGTLFLLDIDHRITFAFKLLSKYCHD